MSDFQRNIAVLGAGITGLMNAYVLMRAGHTVSLYDPGGFPADNASWMAGGMLAPYAEIEHMDLAWVGAGLEGIEAWRDMGLDCGFSQEGSLLVAHPEDRYILERFQSHLPAGAFETVVARDVENDLDAKFQNGVFLKEEAYLCPEQAMIALCDDLKGRVQFSLAAPNIQDIEADTVIDCRGMAAGDPELRGVKGEILIVRNPEFSLSRPVRLMHPRYPLYIVPRADHVFMIGATMVEAEGQGVQMRSAMELMSALYALHPSFGEAEIVEIKAGVRPSYPDNLPRITVCGHVISCNGLFRHGYLLAPVMAACVKDMVADEENAFLPLFRKDSDENYHQRAA